MVQVPSTVSKEVSDINQRKTNSQTWSPTKKTPITQKGQEHPLLVGMFSFCVITCVCFVPTKNLQVDCFVCQKIGGTTGGKRGNAVILVLLLEISKINPCSERVLIS